MQKQFVLITLFVLCITSVLCAFGRTEQKQLNQTISDDEFGMFGMHYYTYHSYFYRLDNPELIDSISVTEQTVQSGEDTLSTVRSTYRYYGNISFPGQHKQVEYYSEIVGDSIPSNHYLFALDTQGRTVWNRLEPWNTSVNSYVLREELYRHYNSDGYADSLYFIYSYDPQPTEHHYYCKRYFEDTMLQSSVIYVRNQINQWIPYIKYTYSYAQNPIEYPSIIRFDNFITQTGSLSFFWKEAIYNPRFATASIVDEYWDGTSWATDDYYSYSGSFTNNYISLYYGQNSIWGSSGGYIVNLEGDFISCHSHANSEDQGSNASYYWNTITSSQDNLAPPVDNILKAYPNPFRSDLNLTLSSKDITPADISIYNVKGQLIRQWNGSKASELVWDGKDASGQSVSSGIYLIKSWQGQQSFITKAIKL